MEDMKVRI